MSERTTVMRNHCLVSFVGICALLIPVLVLAADDAKPLTVELKSFSFKAPEGAADLFGYNADDDKLFFYTNGTAEAKIKMAVDGKQCGKETETSADEPKEYKFPTTLKAGEHKLTIEFTNDVFKE